MKKTAASLLWVLLAIAGAWAYVTLALHKGERINSAYILVAALCSYAIGYRFYSKWIAARVLMLNDRRATPCEVHDDGKDFVRTDKWIVFGQHFAAISGPGPLVGPVLASQFGYLPGTLWILIGVVLGGAVQDFVVLFCSLRRDGKSLGQMVKEELNGVAGFIALVAILAIIVILLAVLALVVVKTLAESPWGLFTVGSTIPIALFMGCYLRYGRVGKVREASAIGVVCLLLAVWGGKLIHQSPALAHVFGLRDITLAWAIIIYGFAASVLPVWLLLAPRGYLSTFMKLGTIFALAFGIFMVLPDLRMPAVSKFVDGTGLIIAGKVFPFCFITIACGSISGFHTLIASGTTPKMLTRESYARSVGYGAMCLESLVAIMALVAACTMDPGIYYGMNVPSAGADSAARAATVNARLQAAGSGPVVSAAAMDHMAATVNEKTLFGRVGGAATLAAGMANIFSGVTGGRWLDLWYHFAIMFEALFILTTIDAGTRVGRYLLHDFLGNLWAPLGDTKNLSANMFASGLLVAGWGYFLIQGVRDPHGGVNSLWPLFGIANQMLAAIGLCLGTTVILKMTLSAKGQGSAAGSRRPALALITLVPLVWLLAVTVTAGVQKIWHPDPLIGFLAQARSLDEKLPALEEAITAARAGGTADELAAAEAARNTNRVLHFNNMLDAAVAGAFLALVAMIVVVSVREWGLLLARRKAAALRETEAVWLPDYSVAEARPLRLAGLLALTFALGKELSGEAQLEREQQAVLECRCCEPGEARASGRGSPEGRRSRQALYLQMTEQRHKGPTHCC
ncbi:MAG TPA: carbon starvation CstA family protein [Candidatus Acidoferrum sp.]|nr:carbon starvation CstA family protein [Candidatus Acidoferrum sp.]